jgi:hypothetical protein
MNMARSTAAVIVLALLGSGATLAPADEVNYFDQDGITYRETVQTTQRTIPRTTMQPQEQTYMRQRYTTELQDTQRTYQVPVTEYQWKPETHRSWNPFSPPYVAYRMVAQTRWETRSETVKIPVAKVETVPEKITHQIPVTTHHVAQESVRTRVAIGPSANHAGTAVAGGTNGSGSVANMASSGGPAASTVGVGGISKMNEGLPKQSPDWSSQPDATSRR